jgi:DNA-binding transcriptional LysR family regulator
MEISVGIIVPLEHRFARCRSVTLEEALRDLEHELGLVLLERSPKEVRLTPVARVFLKEARGFYDRLRKPCAKHGNLAGRRRRNFASATRLPRPCRYFRCFIANIFGNHAVATEAHRLHEFVRRLAFVAWIVCRNFTLER